MCTQGFYEGQHCVKGKFWKPRFYPVRCGCKSTKAVDGRAKDLPGCVAAETGGAAVTREGRGIGRHFASSFFRHAAKLDGEVVIR